MSMDMREFLKKFNMRKIIKNINTIVIFMLIGVFLGADFGYAHDVLRVPSFFQGNGRNDFSSAAATIAKRVGRKKTKHEELLIKRFVMRHQGLLPQLPELQRKVLTFRYIKNMTPREISEELGGISREAVSQYKILGIKRMKELLDPSSDYQLVMRHQGLLLRLPERQRQVLILLYIKNMTQEKEIAEEVGIFESTVSNHRISGIKRLRELLDPDSDYQLVMRHQDFVLQFPERQRQVLTFFYIKNMIQEKRIAEEVGIALSTVSGYLASGIKKLRELVRKERRLSRRQSRLSRTAI